MANMSYCRFENTYRDLSDCLNALKNEGVEDLSESEKDFAIGLIKVCSQIVELGIVDENELENE